MALSFLRRLQSAQCGDVLPAGGLDPVVEDLVPALLVARADLGDLLGRDDELAAGRDDRHMPARTVAAAGELRRRGHAAELRHRRAARFQVGADLADAAGRVRPHLECLVEDVGAGRRIALADRRDVVGRQHIGAAPDRDRQLVGAARHRRLDHAAVGEAARLQRADIGAAAAREFLAVLARLPVRGGNRLLLRMAGFDHLADVLRHRSAAARLDQRHRTEITFISWPRKAPCRRSAALVALPQQGRLQMTDIWRAKPYSLRAWAGTGFLVLLGLAALAAVLTLLGSV